MLACSWPRNMRCQISSLAYPCVPLTIIPTAVQSYKFHYWMPPAPL